MELNTLRAFYNSIKDIKEINDYLLNNIKAHNEKTIVLNHVQLEYNFDKKYVIIVYFVKDKEFPDKKLSFEEFENILQNKAGIYNFTNAILLCAIIDTGGVSKGTDLKNIIEYTDRLNHPIMKFEEFNNGIKYLFRLGLVEEINKGFFVNKEWYNRKFKHRQKTYKYLMIKNIQKQLYLAERNHELNKNIETNISEIEFENIMEEYIMEIK
jgi:hypothetical protein